MDVVISGLQENLNEIYDIHDVLGKGGFSIVFRATHRDTGELVAIKVVNKSPPPSSSSPEVHEMDVNQEVQLLKQLEHPRICSLYQTLDTANVMYIMLEYCAGGELFKYVEERGRLNEAETRRIFKQIVSAVEYLHLKGICHRDLKLENILLDSRNNAKLIDFGLCATYRSGETLNVYCGSPVYAAPELVSQKPYDGFKADTWSLGVLLYCCLNGFFPFYNLDYKQLYTLIKNASYDEPRWLSDRSKRILRWLLQKDPNARPGASEILRSSWCSKLRSKRRLRILTTTTNSQPARPRIHIYHLLSEFYRLSLPEIINEISNQNFGSNMFTTYRILKGRSLKYGFATYNCLGVRIPTTNMSETDLHEAAKTDAVDDIQFSLMGHKLGAGDSESPQEITKKTEKIPCTDVSNREQSISCSIPHMFYRFISTRLRATPCISSPADDGHYTKSIRTTAIDPAIITTWLKVAFELNEIKYNQISESVLTGIYRTDPSSDSHSFTVAVHVNPTHGHNRFWLDWTGKDGPLAPLITLADSVTAYAQNLNEETG